MLVVKVELHSAVTGRVTEIARMDICNIGGTAERGDYSSTTYRGRDAGELAKRRPQRTAEVLDYPRLSIHVWHLVARALVAMGYAGKSLQKQPSDIG